MSALSVAFRVRAGDRRWWLGPRPAGATIPVGQLCELACAWYGDRLSPGWQPRSLEQSQAVLDRTGLAGGFWRLG